MTELRKYRSESHAKVVARRLAARFPDHQGYPCKFTVEQHPYDFGFGIRMTDSIGRTAWVAKGKISPLNARGV